MNIVMETTTKSKKIDIRLPIQTIDQIDSVWREYGFASRSSFIEEAIRHFAVRLKKADLKRQLKAGYIARAQRDADLNRELEVLDSDLG